MNFDIIHDKLSIIAKIYFQLSIQRNMEIYFYIHCHLDSYGAAACWIGLIIKHPLWKLSAHAHRDTKKQLQDVPDLRKSDLRTSALTNRRPTWTDPDLRAVPATNMGIATWSLRFRVPNKRLSNGNFWTQPVRKLGTPCKHIQIQLKIIILDVRYHSSVSEVTG
jgi:hypothetical protein